MALDNPRSTDRLRLRGVKGAFRCVSSHGTFGDIGARGSHELTDLLKAHRKTALACTGVTRWIAPCLGKIADDRSRQSLWINGQHTFDVASEKWRQRAAVTGLHRFETLSHAPAAAPAGEPNYVEPQKPFDPSNDAGALLNQVFRSRSILFASSCSTVGI
jgi:hypothetical protein